MGAAKLLQVSRKVRICCRSRRNNLKEADRALKGTLLVAFYRTDERKPEKGGENGITATSCLKELEEELYDRKPINRSTVFHGLKILSPDRKTPHTQLKKGWETGGGGRLN